MIEDVEEEKSEVLAEPPVKLTDLRRGDVADKAAGMKAVVNSLAHVKRQMSAAKGTVVLAKLNQKKGFDCPSCAWPDPDGHRAMAEFCENGAKAVATEATDKRVTPAFFAEYSVAELSKQSDFWLNDVGRITHPMILREGESHYKAIEWEEAFKVIARELQALDSPNEAVFYTSGRTSNEAAFLYQLFARMYGTNNLPDCSNMCHESSGYAMKMTVGLGKGTVSLDDFEKADAIFVLGQNPGTNHPRMLTTLQKAARKGARIVSANPLPEPGLKAFAHPQEILGALGKATPLTQLFLQIKINGDMAFLKGVMKLLLEEENKAPGTILDQGFIEKYTAGFEDFKVSLEAIAWETIYEVSGLSESEIREAAQILIESKATIFCWAMGLTQHKNAVGTLQDVVNLALMQGNVGKAGAGLCPVRGHSNVQGDRTMGIFERMPKSFHDALDAHFNFESPRDVGYDVVAAIEAMHEGDAKVFVGMGGNFLSASPDTEYTAEAMKRCNLTVQVSTKLNRGHLVTGKTALILPCLGRTEADQQLAGRQFVSVENSMGIVHRSEGRLEPASMQLLSEPAIVCRMAKAVLGLRYGMNWGELEENYDKIRSHIEAVVPGFEQFNQRVRREGGFYLPNGPRVRDFSGTRNQKANFTNNALESIPLDPEQYLLMTIRSHDQFNTTVYAMDDRYRGIFNERRVIFLNKEDMAEAGIADEAPVDITSHFNGEERVAKLFLAIPYSIPRGCAAAYYPETNVLVPIKSMADKSRTPTSKSIVVTLKSSV